MASTDDWLSAVELSTAGDLTDAGEVAKNPFLLATAAPPAAGGSVRMASTHSPQQQQRPKEKEPAAVAVLRPQSKENIRPAPATPGGVAAIARRRRKLPELAPAPGKMRRAASLSFLPSSVGSDGERVQGRPRRRLPTPGQGKLIKEVADKLEEEAKVRLEVARELKDEKRRRWKAEDDLTDVQQKLSRSVRQLKDRRKAEEQLERDLEEERRLRSEGEERCAELEKELRRSKGDMQQMLSEKAHSASDAHQFEEMLNDALQSTGEEKRLRQIAEEKLESVMQRILTMGGRQILEQLMPEGVEMAPSPVPSPMRQTFSPAPAGYRDNVML